MHILVMFSLWSDHVFAHTIQSTLKVGRWYSKQQHVVIRHDTEEPEFTAFFIWHEKGNRFTTHQGSIKQWQLIFAVFVLASFTAAMFPAVHDVIS